MTTNELAIIFCFRDRETNRVKIALDSLAGQCDRDFSVLFIDYGSSPATSAKIETLCAGYPFCTYRFIDTRGRIWNRAEALNYGVLLSDARYIFTADADLAFYPDFIGALKRKMSAGAATFFAVGYLSPSETEKLRSRAPDGLRFRKSETFAKGMMLISRADFHKVNGYNNFYALWGLEDNDIHYRIEKSGMRVSLEREVHMLHQYHEPVHSGLPAGWVQLMKDYFAAYRQHPVAFHGVGELKFPVSRPARMASGSAKPIVIEGRELFVGYRLRRAWLDAVAGSCLTFEIRYVAKPYTKATRLCDALNRLAERISFPLRVKWFYEDQYATLESIMGQLCFFIKTSEDGITDYNLEFPDNSILFTVIKR
jgi:glycosyltransferase involved in cell wall biosynthesis